MLMGVVGNGIHYGAMFGVLGLPLVIYRGLL